MITRYILAFVIVVVLCPVHASLADTVFTPKESFKIDGSSTVFPIMDAIRGQYSLLHPDDDIHIGVSGTGGGFKKFCTGETHIANASRPIRGIEKVICRAKKIEFIELPVAYDALTVVVNKKNTWAKSMRVAELKKIWSPESQGKITKWNQVNPSWPDKPLNLYGPGADSGTYDYFTEVVVGKEHSSRTDYISSEDDNVLVHGVATDENALGFFGMSYYEENTDKLSAVAIDDDNPNNGRGPQLPNREDVLTGTYSPLARPLFVYISIQALKRPNVSRFLDFMLSELTKMVKEVGYVELSPEMGQVIRRRLAEKTTGSAFTGLKPTANIEKLYMQSVTEKAK